MIEFIAGVMVGIALMWLFVVYLESTNPEYQKKKELHDYTLKRIQELIEKQTDRP